VSPFDPGKPSLGFGGPAGFPGGQGGSSRRNEAQDGTLDASAGTTLTVEGGGYNGETRWREQGRCEAEGEFRKAFCIRYFAVLNITGYAD
jgi:hypothetical protein